MPQILAWECPRTQKLFKDKSEYLAHLKNIARERLNDKANQKRLAAKEAFFKSMRDTCKDAEELELFIKQHWRHFIMNAYDTCYWKDKPKRIHGPKLKDIKFDLSWTARGRNTHSSPIGKPTNWHGKPELPNGYPAFVGRLRFSLEKETPSFSSDLFAGTGIHTGSGGGGHNNLSYDVILWADDWSAMAEHESTKQILKKLVAEDDHYERYL